MIYASDTFTLLLQFHIGFNRREYVPDMELSVSRNKHTHVKVNIGKWYVQLGTKITNKSEFWNKPRIFKKGNEVPIDKKYLNA